MKLTLTVITHSALVLYLGVSCVHHNSARITGCQRLENLVNPKIHNSWLREDTAPSQLRNKQYGNLTGGVTLGQFLEMLQPTDRIIHYKAPKDVELNEDYMTSIEGYVLVRRCRVIAFLSTNDSMIMNDVER